MVSLYIGITDYDWFRFPSALPGTEEVNFWQPGGRTNFRALRPGELFLISCMRLETSLSVAVFLRVPTSCQLRWHGTRSAQVTEPPRCPEMRARIARYRNQTDDPR